MRMCPASDLGWRRPIVVLVDDDPEILRSLGRALRHEPYELLSTMHPGDVLRWICERPVDLVISDQRMPEMNGTDLLEVVRDYSPGTACIILSGYPDTALIVEESKLRLEHLISKPWENGALTATLRSILEKRLVHKADEAPEPPTLPACDPATPLKKELAIDCAGRSARDVVAEILRICSKARGEGRTPTIVLANLTLLGDSVSRLLKGLARAVAWSHFPIDLRDDSGCLAAFLSALSRTSVHH
jgi:FixJ family two-component response regulator